MGKPRVLPVTEMWPDSTVVVVGSGPSAEDSGVRHLSSTPIIAVNSSYRLAPQADAHFAFDMRWFRWNPQVFQEFHGRMFSAMPFELAGAPAGRLTYLHRGDIQQPFEVQRTHVCGRDSGMMAINLAVHLGARRLVLVGFDMQAVNGKLHWHEDHKIPSKESMYTKNFLPMYAKLKTVLDGMGIRVINASQESLIDCWPKASLKDAISLLTHRGTP